MSDIPTIEEISLASEQLGLATDASELHGALCGWLAGGGVDTRAWPAQVLADDQLQVPTADSPLDRLRQVSARQLEDRDFAFELLLPDGSESLFDRAGALFAWCRGFLGGFGLAAGPAAALSEEGREALQDLARLAQAEPENNESDGEEEEDALAEIEEFVRVAVLLLHGDCVMAPRHRQSLN